MVTTSITCEGDFTATSHRCEESGIAIKRAAFRGRRTAISFKGTKTDSSERLVTLPPSALKILAIHKLRQSKFRAQFGDDYRHDLDLIFAQPDGAPLRPDSISASVSALFKRLKLPKGASLHTLRHTHGSHLIAAGMEISAVSERLGHSNVRVTAEVYTHAIRGRDDEAARRWEEFQNPPEID